METVIHIGMKLSLGVVRVRVLRRARIVQHAGDESYLICSVSVHVGIDFRRQAQQRGHCACVVLEGGDCHL